MREILFKAKRVDNGEWCYGVPLVEGWSKKTYMASYEYSSLAFVQQIEVCPETICQFSGLYDKNGKQIWENDVVKVKHGMLGREEEKPKTPRNAYGLHFEENERGLYGRWFYYRNYAVEYKAHGNSRGKYIVRNGSDQCDFTNSLFINHDAEIIGNRFDNSELLSAEQQNEKGR